MLDDNNKPIKVFGEEYFDWWRKIPESKRVGAGFRVKLTEKNNISVSTVFLGFCFEDIVGLIGYVGGIGNGPKLWETLITGGLHDGKRVKYDSQENAEEGHNRIVKMCFPEIVDWMKEGF